MALLVSIVALFVALGATGYAAFRLPAGSVGTAQLKDGAVTGRKVHPHTLLASDFKPGQFSRGRGGLIGPTGPRGATGAAGKAGSPGAPGAPGAPGTARAFGLVQPTGTLVQSRSKGIASVGHPAVGVYCITLDSTIDPATTTSVAVPDDADPTSSSKAIAQINSGAADCPAGRLEVILRRISIDTTVNPPQIVDHHADNGFSFVVP